MSAFWELKMRSYFRRMDHDGDGSITEKDFEGFANNYVVACKLDKIRSQQIHETMQQVYKIHTKVVGGEEGVALLTEDNFVENFRKQLKDPKLASVVKTVFSDALFKVFGVIDLDGDGLIQKREYEIFFEVATIDPNLAPASFEAIDTNGDGCLSQTEFVAAGIEFFFSEDETLPTQLFWGPLISSIKFQ